MNTFEKIYEVVCKIPKGKVCTYGIIAAKCGIKNPRVVGFALHQNKKPIVVPCHRVVNRFGQLSKAFVFGGENIQKQWLKNEGVQVVDNGVDLNKYLYKFESD